MRFDPAQLDTLVAIAEEGSFDAAARRLHVTPSAVSQRIRALEQAAGTVLVRRSAPSGVTVAGEPLLRLGRQLRLLATEAEAALKPGATVEISVGVNADSLATWFRPVLAGVAERPGTALLLHVEDQAYSRELLRRGEVVAAVTDDPKPVQGCACEPLGSLRYLPVVALRLAERHHTGRGVAWGQLPMVVFNEKDHLQDDALRATGRRRPDVIHRVPSTADHREAVRCGVGWGMLPEQHAREDLASGLVRPVGGLRHHDVALFWQRWRLASPALEALSDDVRRAAARLRPPARLG